ncbi:ATP phosphoribosyltransferase regulatory subunit [Merismopedia glauca]|uniref:ATP phosphoribosyltransferase regulatory subunit n=1 Tax=Merismopedia glauca CCAP 1448/3 TaxID=1296344 RepID=A0A2T1C3V6_9CYAN|nr:ATP phosphoribosyltransferase regulatory subunit [Merismopedia glauca]PSB02904.1 ATP phosphoribosyltransferase regulatory subunit [Merismopedia glauca CCAP 1448/3]
MVDQSSTSQYNSQRLEDKNLSFYSSSVRDLLPLDVAQKCCIEAHLQQVFQKWGYHRIITSTLERLDALMAGGAIKPKTVLQLENAEAGTLGLRPELTASIARASVTRMGSIYPQRLYYNDNVFRRSLDGDSGSQQEFYQAGVELLGAGGLLADAEILLLLADSLQELGVDDWHLVLGESGLTRSLLATFPTQLQAEVRLCLAHLDRIGLENLGLIPEQLEIALSLFDLRGEPEVVLESVSQLPLDELAIATVDNLKSLIGLLQKNSKTKLPLILDLSLIQTFDYYTGIVFEVVSYTASQTRVIGQGGRYDRLLGLYHPQGKNYPGIGFSLNIEDLHQVLTNKDILPQKTPASDWLVVSTSPEAHSAALAHAQKLRSGDNLVRVEMEISDRTQKADILDYALRSRIPNIAWVQADGTIEKSEVRSQKSEVKTNS